MKDQSDEPSQVKHNNTPLEIIYHRRSRLLELIYSERASVKLGSEYLRVFSPSAEVQGHSPEQAVLQVGKQDVNIVGIEHKGRYAIKITFDDKHDTGIYTWHYLAELADNHEINWQQYLNKLNAFHSAAD